MCVGLYTHSYYLYFLGVPATPVPHQAAIGWVLVCPLLS